MLSKVKFEIISGLYCEFISYLVQEGYYISAIESTQFGVTAECMAEDYRNISRIAKRFQCRTNLLARKGVFFIIRPVLKRKGLLTGTAAVFICIFLFSNIIWRIDVISPDTNITKDVYGILYKNDIYTGSIFSQEKNSKTIQEIFIKVDNVGYVTMNFSKGILTCKVDPTQNKLPYLERSTNGNITATESGVIEDLRVYKGFSQVYIGQSVYKGDILVSSTYIDRNGTLQQVMPRAYIKAFCEKEYTAQVEFEKDIYVRTGSEENQIRLKMFGRNITMKKADISQWDMYEKELTYKPVSLFGFRFPATMEISKYYKKELVRVSKNDNTALYSAIKIIDSMIENDKSLIAITDKEYLYTSGEHSLNITCSVQGYYDITV